MPGQQHDTINVIIRESPKLALWALRTVAGLDLEGPGELSVATGEINNRVSADRQADTLIVQGPQHQPHRLFVCEVESRLSHRKLRQCLRYAATLWVRHEAPVHVVIFSPDPRAGEFPASVSLTAGALTTTLSLCIAGPDQIPAITDPESVAADPSLATLSVMAHGADEEVDRAYMQGLDSLPDGDRKRYLEHAFGIIDRSTQRTLEALMARVDWPVNSNFAKKHYGAGEVNRAIRCLLKVLESRDVQLSADERKRIVECEDLEQLDDWLGRAARAICADELFA
ncbi:hypothetical protein [Actinomadura parmotrematis]|uniref:DUF4365 domain-containing protein n=1 Tax=Actinomadura parmotrematis TaxID=2864039 RepID=A0ABS7FP37_9ACTN|nr:hypothetical protein [Actinomadura parmotrematis]MBW8482143.1 hypothetical protein [Actinomadura parmotrematis]